MTVALDTVPLPDVFRKHASKTTGNCTGSSPQAGRWVAHPGQGRSLLGGVASVGGTAAPRRSSSDGPGGACPGVAAQGSQPRVPEAGRRDSQPWVSASTVQP